MFNLFGSGLSGLVCYQSFSAIFWQKFIMLFSAQFKTGSRQVGNRQIPELLTAYLPTAYLSNLFGSGFARLW
jgi:hypothetical protein